jgi:hypothetical protein
MEHKTKVGWREIGGTRKYYRSAWEANFARYLQWLKEHGDIKEWQHEPETFWFPGIKRGTLSYLVDFKVTENNGKLIFYEVKGYMDAKSKTKLRRMKKYYPHLNLVLIDSKIYRNMAAKLAGMITGWE